VHVNEKQVQEGTDLTGPDGQANVGTRVVIANTQHLSHCYTRLRDVSKSRISEYARYELECCNARY
jgi:hypothetical protein